ncbi:Ran GTPase-activating protein 1 [Wickerhamomyces ciferrii]|uniref:Ran GTPase-activating protein 1 n=1 Tax=Wickerhamomyces ciferrii (strain ATCC 14091 / BCRC 22168 / CBS 111 / JCM 3599 / NBRC 0793 / NRRL Y-1031 F-60-10) TaxID=1206466 RepID=K0KG97_WICCF|nr:Ran GTPase-activating protein 1 [Wickerhamomyces ciferrii]CCH41207.1 Ran GTPase-activating protein 1 [Wickerhamomyces ciferrii]
MASLDFIPQYKPEEIYSLAGKSIKFDTKADIEPYLTNLNSLTGIKKLDFSGNTIGIEASLELSKSITLHAKTLEEVNFADFFTGRLKDEIPQCLEYLLPSISQCPQLHIVNLSDNAFGLTTIEQLEKFLSEAIYLNHLILSNNGMGPFAGERIGKSLYKLSLSKSTQGQSSLKTFICGRNRLENGSINYLSIGLKNHKDLQVVKLYQNGIRPSGIKKLISQGLKFNTQLTILDLQDNTITKKSGSVLADNLPQWPELKELNVNDCLLNPKGSLDLIKSLEKTKFNKLESLKLQYNELDNDSLKILSSIISENLPVLTKLELNGNRFEEDSELIEKIQSIFEERGFGELDELDDLEELDSEDEDEDESDEEDDEEEEEEIDLNELELKLKESTTKEDKKVEDIASELEKTHI